MEERLNSDLEDKAMQMREDWLKQKAEAVAANAEAVAPSVFFHMYNYNIRDERGREDTYWRFERIQGESSGIHREYNSKMLAMRELDKLRGDGHVVHIIRTPEELAPDVVEAHRRLSRELYGRWMAGEINFTEMMELRGE
ncbi:hypothetical protein F9K96_00370 [Brucella anthropi]|uniref:hypothetical protein n=1 Tax=Brucella anthropi TaxID=529 RepID=UPI00124D21C7|nr:hypothetical protein [Brucella anthropi]KAB2793664.1 hypothetical protein F9K96_00370 [Brucella anthropi]